ncbi:outer membrane lipoprotein-sorting protein [Cerasicoccus arenae]|uniref:outer membrane lipoprotein-sorting protein n=1 Tax=Cerasicoccus arenae TaxID=424488 RepID=UPI00167632BA|nr:outer membrane lipoprotein-sorting protein [Cerasicoccus arenae]
MAFILSPFALQANDASKLDGPQLMNRYAETQTVDAELAFIELKTFETETPTENIIKKRLLAVTRKDGNGGYDYLIRLLVPKDVEGVSVLTNVNNGNTDQYLYLPAQGKPVQIGTGMSGNFLGSDFAYEDLIRETPSNYNYERLPDAVAQGEVCAVILAKPSEVEGSQYAYRKIYLDPISFEVRKIEFFSEDGSDPVKELQAYEYRSPNVDGSTVRPRFAVMTNLETGTISVFKVLKSRLNLPLDEALFTSDNLPNISESDINGLLVEVDAVGSH